MSLTFSLHDFILTTVSRAICFNCVLIMYLNLLFNDAIAVETTASIIGSLMNVGQLVKRELVE
jgi:hypothetical protein